MMLELAGYRPNELDAIGDWSLRYALIAYEARLIDQERHAFEHRQLLAVLGGTKDGKMPQVPALLRRRH